MDAQQDAEIFQKIVAALEPIGTYKTRLEALKLPPRGSRAAQSSKRVFGNLHTTFALSALSSATDHALTWRLIVHGPGIPVSGHWALIRGAMEGAVIARWLIDPTIEYAERIRRGAVMQLEDWRRRERFERSLGVGVNHGFSPGTGKSGAERVVEHGARMKGAKLVPEDQDLKDVKPESMTNMVRAYGHESLWRMASAFAHSAPWSAMLLQKEEIEGQAVTGSKRVRVTARMDYAYVGTLAAMRGIKLAVSELETHYKSGSG